MIAIAPVSASQAQVLFSQPSLTAIGPVFYNAKVMTGVQPLGRFLMVLEQPNPNRVDGLTVPVTKWDAGAKTGLHVANLSTEQTGYADQASVTVGQVSGGEVGAYLNSSDLTSHGACDKMMITPAYKFPAAAIKYPFATSTGAVKVTFDLQVPTAVGTTASSSNALVASDLKFFDPVRKVAISTGVNVFYLGAKGDGVQAVGYDPLAKNYMLNAPLVASSTWVKALPGSATRATATWTGYRTYSYQLSRANFQLALNTLHATYPTLNMSSNPKDYGLILYHLNAELHCSGGHAELGWSMRNLSVSLTKAQ